MEKISSEALAYAFKPVKGRRVYSTEKLDKIRAVNGQHFITNLRKYPCYVQTKTGALVLCRKHIVWIMAEDLKLPYEILTLSNGSKIFAIL